MTELDYNYLLVNVSKKIQMTEDLKHVCRWMINIPESEIKSVWDLLVAMEKGKRKLGPDNLDALKELLNKLETEKSLLKDVKEFEKKRKETMSGIVPSLKCVAGKVGSGFVGATKAMGKLVGAVIIQTTFSNAAGILVGVSAGWVLYNAETLEDYMKAFNICVLPAGIFLRSISEKCLLFTVQAETPSALEMLWKEYMGGTLQKQLQEFLVTQEVKEFTREEDLEVKIYIDGQEYKDALLDLLIKESNVNLKKHPQERCRRKSDSDLHIKPTETDVTVMRLRQVESRLLLERERKRQTESENEREEAAVSDGESTGDEIYAATAPLTAAPEATTGPSGLVEYTREELNYFRICHIIYKLIPEGLREIFKQEWDFRYKTTHGEWKDKPKNGRDLCALEGPTSRRRNASLIKMMQNGNRAEWSPTCLFFVLLFSDGIGVSLSSVVKLPIYELRAVRNSIAHLSKASLTDVEFQNYADRVLHAFKSLGLSISDVEAVKSQRSFKTAELKLVEKLLDSVTEKRKAQAALSITEEYKAFSRDVSSKVEPFCSLTFKPFHQIIERSSDVKRILEKMKEIEIKSNGLVTTIYFSGSSGCGKSQLARQIGQEFFTSRSRGPTFVGTINAETLQTTGDSYIILAKQLGIVEDTLTILAIAMAERPMETLNHLKELILSTMRKFSSWLIIVDNVADLTMVHNYLPQTASEEWGHGQVLITTQDSSSIPTSAPHTYHESLNEGMLQDDAMKLLKEVSQISNQDPDAEHVVKSLDHQPLALAAAALYARAVVSGGSPNYSWSEYFESIIQGERRPVMTKITDECSRAMATSIKVAIDKVMETDEILRQTFTLFSLCASDSLPIQAAIDFVKYRSIQSEESEEKIKEHLLESSSFLCVSEEDGSPEYLRLHGSVLQVLKTEDILESKPDERAKCFYAALQVLRVLLDEKQKNKSKDEKVYLQLRKIKSHLSSIVTSISTSMLTSVS